MIGKEVAPKIIHVTHEFLQSNSLEILIKESVRCHLIIDVCVDVHLNLVGACKTEHLTIELRQGAQFFCLTNVLFGTVTVTCNQDSRLFWCSVWRSSARDSQRMAVRLVGANSSAHISLFPFLQQGKKLNLYTEQIHSACCTKSVCHTVGSLEDNVMFKQHGTIVIEKNLKSIHVDQHAKLLLFGQPEYALVIPELDIQSSSVNCLHGAAIGLIENDILWYLAMRGIGVAESQNIVLQALCLKSLETIENSGFRKDAEKLLVS